MGILDEICPVLGRFLTLSKNAYTKFYAGPQKSRKVGLNLRTATKVAGTLVAPYVWPVFGASFLKDTFSDQKLVRQQMLCLGVTEFYLNHLSDFLKE